MPTKLQISTSYICVNFLINSCVFFSGKLTQNVEEPSYLGMKIPGSTLLSESAAEVNGFLFGPFVIFFSSKYIQSFLTKSC